ncbi:MAG: hypothetical protein GY749_39510 [Desulfobacteraceae bacterium]|nr:hypothetical protein [Lentisphaerota bacterium]MCP4111549.1 hypothetical protein [Desulfobacteraceae bacterium]
MSGYYKESLTGFIEEILKRYRRSFFRNSDQTKIDVLTSIKQKIENSEEEELIVHKAYYLKKICRCVMIIRGRKKHTRSAEITISLLKSGRYPELLKIVDEYTTSNSKYKALQYDRFHTFAYPELTLTEITQKNFSKKYKKALLTNGKASRARTRYFLSYAVNYMMNSCEYLFSKRTAHASVILSTKQDDDDRFFIEHCFSLYPHKEMKWCDVKGDAYIDGYVKIHLTNYNEYPDNKDGKSNFGDKRLFTRTYEIDPSTHDHLLNAMDNDDPYAEKGAWRYKFHPTKFSCHSFVLSYLQSAGIYDSFFTQKSYFNKLPKNNRNGFQLSTFKVEQGYTYFEYALVPIYNYSPDFPSYYMKVCGNLLKHGCCVEAGKKLLQDYVKDCRSARSRHHIKAVKEIIVQYKLRPPETIGDLLEIIDARIDRNILPVGSLSRRYAFITYIPDIALTFRSITRAEYNKQQRACPGRNLLHLQGRLKKQRNINWGQPYKKGRMVSVAENQYDLTSDNHNRSSQSYDMFNSITSEEELYGNYNNSQYDNQRQKTLPYNLNASLHQGYYDDSDSDDDMWNNPNEQ